MKKIALIVLLVFTVAWAGVTIIKTKFSFVVYDSSVEEGGSTVADFDSSSIILDAVNSAVWFFDPTGDSANVRVENDSMLFEKAVQYRFDGDIYMNGTQINNYDLTQIDSIVYKTNVEPKIIGYDSSCIKIAGYFVSKNTFDYTTTSNTVIKVLPANAILWMVRVHVIAGFNDSGTDLVRVGRTGDDWHYMVNQSVATPDSWALSSLNSPDALSGNMEITIRYTPQNADVSAGTGEVYIFYSIF